jgi:hypothetical protein
MLINIPFLYCYIRFRITLTHILFHVVWYTEFLLSFSHQPVNLLTTQFLMFVDLCIIVQFIKKNLVRCNSLSKFYYSIFMWISACFGRHTAHHQEPKSALAASGFSYVEGCWTCSWWTLSGTLCLTTSIIYTANNLPRMKNQRLPVEF